MIRRRFCGQTLWLESKVQLFGRHDLSLLGLLFVNAVRQGFAIIQDGDLIQGIDTHRDLGVPQRIGRAIGLDLVNDLFELQGEIFGKGARFLPGQNPSEILFGGEGAMGIHGTSRFHRKALVEVRQELRQIGIPVSHVGDAT